jgi:hypothetical protein
MLFHKNIKRKDMLLSADTYHDRRHGSELSYIKISAIDKDETWLEELFGLALEKKIPYC